ncbi:FMN-binding glutamate synthase family protein [Acetonema longum]|uniref:Ferredoxin-dependent glutamate synthase n=1 Tax=Acetonema longum DSM 6540 TaxID=1009370 RepID=F7NFV3_9FIRM|nr:FMN-binding glutamate synthase family protein [Acetonema longum]EGO65061.1 ferredoxin-dependent glutamate synthase [Acetonema longum DSM 6540]
MPIIISNFHLLWLLVALLIIAITTIILLARPFWRYLIEQIMDEAVCKLLSRDYEQNPAELYSSLKRFSVLNLIETSLRAESGKAIVRPLGSPKNFLGYDNLMFTPRQMTVFPLPENAPVDMSVILGTKAQKPLKLPIPLMIGAMAYGLAVSEEAKLALAKASKLLQTATNSGEGPFLPEEPVVAGKFILQICRWPWGDRTDEQIAAADMLEVQMGQGADMGTSRIDAVDIEGRARILGGLAAGEPAIALPAPPGIRTITDWPDFMVKLRQKAKGIPIGLKLMATDRIEEELEMAVKLGFDTVAIDGSGGGSHATAPIKQDDFGVPNIYALLRAKQYLKNTGISLVVSGGFFSPGQCLKALALGADAIYLGTVPLLALAHNQSVKASPWEPPTTLVYYNSPMKTQLHIGEAAVNVANALHSMILEMQEILQALGKSSLKELCPDDLVALDAFTAKLTGVKLQTGLTKAKD